MYSIGRRREKEAFPFPSSSLPPSGITQHLSWDEEKKINSWRENFFKTTLLPIFFSLAAAFCKRKGRGAKGEGVDWGGESGLMGQAGPEGGGSAMRTWKGGGPNHRPHPTPPATPTARKTDSPLDLLQMKAAAEEGVEIGDPLFCLSPRSLS